MRMAAQPVRLAPEKRSKYRAQPTVVDGIQFASKAEARRFSELKLLEKAGEIRELRRQVPFPLCVVPERSDRPRVAVGDYVADFTYCMTGSVALVVEDVKSPPTKTALYRWKRRHMMAQYGITIREIH